MGLVASWKSCDMTPSLRFGTSVYGHKTATELLDFARRAEAGGLDVLTVPDHIGGPAPFQLLAAVAGATKRVRLRTYVLNAYFWNSALLARETATLDSLSHGRVELGVGAGYVQREHEVAGLPFPPLSERWQHVQNLVTDVRRRLEDPEHRPEPVQRPIPVMVAGMGTRGLRAAAQLADVVGLTGAMAVPGQPPGALTLVDSATTDDRVELVRSAAEQAGRQPELDALLQRVVLTEDPEKAAADMVAEGAASGADWFTVELLLDSPFVLFAESPQAAAEELVRRSERWGITSWSTHTPSADTLMEVAAAVRAR